MADRRVAVFSPRWEWAANGRLGVALINEIWPDRSRAFLAGLVGAAGNVGYLVIALVGRGLTTYVHETKNLMLSVGVSQTRVDYLMGSDNSGWRILMMLAAVPALLTFFIRIFVPESERWEHERERGATSHWANRDLLAVVVGSIAACGIVFLWAVDFLLLWRILGTVVGLAFVTVCYLYPVSNYLKRAAAASPETAPNRGVAIRLMLLAACLSGVALMGTWGTIQQAPSWADELAATMSTSLSTVRSDTLIWSSVGAVVGTIVAALVAELLGRRITYSLLCLGSLIIIPTLFLASKPGDAWFLPVVFLSGAITASFYGWLPLYLPELFPTSIRATGQGFGFNFGRVIAAIGVLQLGNLKVIFGRVTGWGTSEVFALASRRLPGWHGAHLVRAGDQRKAVAALIHRSRRGLCESYPQSGCEARNDESDTNQTCIETARQNKRVWLREDTMPVFALSFAALGFGASRFLAAQGPVVQL